MGAGGIVRLHHREKPSPAATASDPPASRRVLQLFSNNLKAARPPSGRVFRDGGILSSAACLATGPVGVKGGGFAPIHRST